MRSNQTLPVRKLRLHTTLVVPFILQLMLTVGLVGYLSFRNGQKAIHNLANQLNREISARIEQYVIEYLNKSQNTLLLTYMGVRSGNFNLKDFTGLRRYFWQVVRTGELEGYLSYGSEEGEFVGVEYQEEDGSTLLKIRTKDSFPMREIYRLDEEGNPQKLLTTAVYETTTRPWYQAAYQAKKPTWSEIYPFFSRQNTVLGISPVYPVFDDHNQLLGVLCINVRLTRITDFIKNMVVSTNGESFIMERSGDLVAGSKIAQPFKVIGKGDKSKFERIPATKSDNPVIRAMADNILQNFGDFHAIQGDHSFQFQTNGIWYYAQILPIKDGRGIDWLTGVVVPESDFMDQINKNNQTTILLCLLALGIALVMGIRTAYWITIPLLKISQASQAVAQGNLNQKVDSSLIIEIAILSDTFNEMTSQLKASVEALHLANEELEVRVEKRTQQLSLEKERSEQLLLNILPFEIAERLKRAESPTEYFAEVTILFADIVGFTHLSTQLEPMQLVAGLNQIFSAFDQLTEKYGLEKIKTIGDAYMVVGGLPITRPDHAEAIANMALDMQHYLETMTSDLGDSLQLRIGINTGPVIAGVIGIKKFIYDLWGDAVNIASRMESHGQPGYIQVTEATYHLLQDQYVLKPRGTIAVKGRGEMMTYWLISKKISEA